MEDKKINLGDCYVSLLHIQALLEEMVWQQILARNKGDEESKNVFNEAMKNVSDSVKSVVENLPKA